MNLQINEKIIYKLLVLTITSISFFISLYQLNNQYDGHHHGIIYSITNDFYTGKIPYKDFFPHYGIFFIFINSIFLKIFSTSIYGTYFLISLSKALIVMIFSFIIKEKFNEKISIIGMLILFMLHPFVDTPYPDYLFFLILLLSLYLLIIPKNKYFFFMSGFLYSIAGMTKENFFFFLMVSIGLLVMVFFFMKFLKKEFRIILNLYWFIGYLLPILLLLIYLEHNSILTEYLYSFKLGELTIKNICTSETNIYWIRIIDCAYISLNTLIKYSFQKIFTEPYWLLFLIILLFNFIYIVKIIFLEKEKKISDNDKIMLFISILSLVLFLNNLYYLTIQRLYTGVSVGLIVVIYLVQKFKSPINRYIVYTLILFFLINGLQFARTPNNPIYPTYTAKFINEKNEINFLKYKKMSNLEWKQLIVFKELTDKIKLNCSSIKYSTNLTNDLFYRIILKENFELLNFIPFGERMKMFSEMYRTFDNQYYSKLNEKINQENIVIVIDNILKQNKDFSNKSNFYLVKQIKYNNYGTKYINVYLPDSCKINL